MDVSPTSGQDAVSFIWSNQSGIFELAREPDKRHYFKKSEALTVLDQYRYFAPLARKKRGSTKSDVADTGNVLWADIDDLNGLDERLQRLSTSPSLVVFSGRKGYWVYLKLAQAIPTDEVELMNIGLETLLDADNCHNRDRLARLPGSIHQDSGRLAEVVEFSGLVYSPEDLAFLKDHAPPRDSPPGEPVFDGTAPVLTSFPSGFPALGPDLWDYIERSPKRGEYGYDRSRMEQKIFTALGYQGWTDDEIITFATVYRLPRHLQEWARHKDYSWTNRSLRKVREYIATHPPSPKTSIDRGMCIGSETNGSYSHADRHKALRLVTGKQKTKELVQTWITKLPTSRSTAYRMLYQFRESDLIHKEGRIWKHTELGEHHTKTKMNYLMVLPKIRPNSLSSTRTY
jgi:hypothetical protein